MINQKIRTLKNLSVAVTLIMTGLVSINASATEKSNSSRDAQVIYQSHSINHSIFGYAGRILGEVSIKPELIYVSQANGPAIYSYTHSGSEKTVPWNVQYVDTAYGQAIYSYGRHQTETAVKIMPIVID